MHDMERLPLEILVFSSDLGGFGFLPPSSLSIWQRQSLAGVRASDWGIAGRANSLPIKAASQEAHALMLHSAG